MINLVFIVIFISNFIVSFSKQLIRVSPPQGNDSTFLYYLVIRNKARLIPNGETMGYLGLGLANAKNMTFALLNATFQVHPPVPVIHQENYTPDEIVRLFLVINDVLQPESLIHFKYVGNYINPSFVKWRNRVRRI